MGGKVQGGPVQYNRCGNDPIYLFPEYKYNLFTAQNYSRAIYLRERGGADHEKAEDGTVPSFVPLNARGRHEGSPQKMMKRDFIIFPAVDGRYNIVPDKTSGKKDITLCFLNNLGNSKYEYYLKTDRGGKKPEINCAFIVIEVCENKSGKKAEFEYTPLGRGLPVKTEKIEIRKDELDEMYMFKFKINVYDDNPGNGAGNKTPERYKYEGEKTIRIRAGMKEESGNIIWSPASGITMMFCPCAGWTLAEGGQMVQGATGYLIDENGYYILEDGKRVSDEMIIESRYGEKDIRIGDKDVSKGLSEILGITDSAPVKTVYNDVYNELLKSSQSAMLLVVYQAFQINRGYKLKNEWKIISDNNKLNRDAFWESCGEGVENNARFGVIGLDETGIPVVVTRIGEDRPGKKKLVIAGPHGDERNAQRLIMAAQKHFLQNIISGDLVLYFIPCLSPTMCFADARGIPNKFWENTVQKIPTKHTGNSVEVKVLTLSNDKAVLKPGLTIPELHDSLVEPVKDDIWEENGGWQFKEIIMRTAIQSYNGSAFKNINDYNNKKVDPNYPRHGIDSNRDVRRSLQSTRVFEAFIKSLLTSTVSGNIKVIMMHGYEGQGTVYGTYDVNPNTGRAEITDGRENFAHAFWEYLYGLPRTKPKFYGNTEWDPLLYAGEWNQLLYKDNYGILSVDIELPGSFDEGRRGQTDGKAYDDKKVRKEFDGILATGKGNYYELLEDYSSIIGKYKA